MNKNKFNISNYFNGKLFYEAFKQLRVVGIASFICLNALAIFLPIINYLEATSNNSEYINYRILFQPNALMLPLIAVIFIVAPIMFLMLFSFLTKRNGSDFYHSLPVKRSCMFVSFILAITSWLLILTASYTLLTVISANISYEHFVIDYSTVISYGINVFVSSMLIIGAFTIGTAITGTATSNIFFSCGILFLPRIIITVLSNLLLTYSDTLTPNSGFAIFDSLINLPFSIMSVIFNSEEPISRALMQLGKHSLYTILLAVIYIVIGMKLFAKRPSEVSSKSFSSNKIFAIFRITTGFCLSLIIVATIYPTIANEDLLKWVSAHMTQLILSVLAVIMSMFALETANTKSIKKGLKATLYTPLILVMDIAILLGMYSIDCIYNSETLNKANIDYVYVGDFYKSAILKAEEYSAEYSVYCCEHINETKITDKEVIDFLTEIYNSNKDNNNDTPYHYATFSYEITFDSTFGEKTRYVYMTKQQVNKLTEMLSKNEDIKKCFYQFPDADDSAVSCYDMSTSDCDKLYASLVEELKELSYEQLYKEYCNEVNMSDYEYAETLYIETFVNGNLCTIDMPITTLTPKTYAMALNSSNKAHTKAINKFIDAANANALSYDMYVSLSATDILSNGLTAKNYILHSEDSSLKDENMILMLQLLKDVVNKDEPITLESITDTKTLICCLYFNHLDTYGSYYFTIPSDSPILEHMETYD